MTDADTPSGNAPGTGRPLPMDSSPALAGAQPVGPDTSSITSTTAARLGPDDRGRWLITTQTSQHVLDLDAGTWQRLPGQDAPTFRYDLTPLCWTRLDLWPAVGGAMLVCFDVQDGMFTVEHWRLSSPIRSIERLSTPARQMPPGVASPSRPPGLVVAERTVEQGSPSNEQAPR